MPTDKSIAVWGDGAVGTGLAVALARSARVLLVGAPGSGRGRALLESTGAYPGIAEVEKMESGDAVSADVCLVAVKAYDIAEVAGPAIESTSGPCVCLSNGMGLEHLWGDLWKIRVEPAVLTAGFSMTGGGRVETTAGEVTVTSDGVAGDLFSGSGIPVRRTSSMETLRWGKWIVNSVINPLGAITGLRNDQLLAAGLGDAVETLFSELLSAVPAGHRSGAGKEALTMMKDLLGSSSNRCSMLQDLAAGRRTEIDFMTGLCPELSSGECPASVCITGLVKAMSPRV